MVHSKYKMALFLISCLAMLGAGLGLVSSRYAGAEPPKGPPMPAEKAAPEARPAPEDLVKVRGRVLDPDGKAFAGAKLYLVPFGREKSKLRARATSGADGRFELSVAKSELRTTFSDNPSGQVLAMARGYGFDVALVDPSSKEELTLRLVKDHRVSGRILNQEGMPVAGATLRVTDVRAYKGEDLKEELAELLKGGFGTHWVKSWGGSIPGQPAATTTGPDGRFSLEGLGRERMVFLQVEGPGIHYARLQVMTHPGKPIVSTTAFRSLRVHAATFDHFADPSRPIRGVVRDKSTSKPVAGVQISAHFTTHQTTTDKDGRYELLGYPKSKKYELSAVAPAGLPYFTASARFEDTQGLGPLDADIQMVRGIQVRGRVTDKSTGKPIKAGGVAYHPLYPNVSTQQGPRDSNARIGRDGSFVVVVAPGPGLLAVTAEGGPQDHYMPALVTHKEMKAFFKNWSDPGNGNNEDFLMVAAGGLAARLIAQTNYHALVLIEPDEKTEKLTRDVALLPAPTLKGNVAGPDGKPLGGVTVFGLAINSFGQETLKTDDFVVRGLHPGRKRELLFLHKGKGLGFYKELGGTQKEPLAIKLQPLGSASGRIVDRDGQPVPGLTFDLYRSRLLGPGGVRVQSDKDGRFRAEGLVPGQKYMLSPANRSMSLRLPGGAFTIVVESGRDKNVGDVTASSSR
jgi:hypothetical protein